jgi:hypothetical protein
VKPAEIVAERLQDPTLAPDTNIAECLDSIAAFLRRFVALSDAQVVAIALWTVFTYCADAFEIAGYLSVFSAVKRSGKTLLLDVLRCLVHAPLLAADLSPAVLFRVMEELRPTVLIDEVDVLFGGKTTERSDELRALLNAGYRRGGAAWRMEMGGKAATVRSFDVYGPKALAGIGRLPDTISDRCIPIELTRKVRGIDIERFRSRGKQEETAPLREQVATWAEGHRETLGAARPNLPDELNDRQQDVWEPLLAIAGLAGGLWPERAKAAACELHGDGHDEADTTVAVLLLEHLRDLFGEHDNPPSMSTDAILSGLVEDDRGPWGRWWSTDHDHGKRSAASALAKMLRPFGIRSATIRLAESTLRGYRLASFSDAWERYLPAGDATDATDATTQVGPTSTVASVADVASTPQPTAESCDCGHEDFMHFGDGTCRRPACPCGAFSRTLLDAREIAS